MTTENHVGKRTGIARLLLSLWTTFFLWLAAFQFYRHGWGWALGDLIFASLGACGYVELVIDEMKREAQP